MRRAIALAWRSAGHTRPNPPVGAVVVKGGKVIGEGRHRRCGGDHAETAALKACKSSPVGATVYVTLEPCSKPGRVGACCDALVAARVKRVVWACADPNPTNRGRAARVLRKAGIVTAHGICADEAAELIRPFAKHVTTGMPYVTVKLAQSLDGKICDNFGSARWISSERSRRTTGRLRERVDAIMVGAETVRTDNPSLLCHTRRNDDLWRVVVSRSGKLPRKAQVFTDAAKDRTLVFRDAAEAVRELGRRGFMHVLCEGGLGLARSLAAAGLVDEWITVLAPIVIGDGHLSDAFRFPGEDTIVVSASCLVPSALCGADVNGASCLVPGALCEAKALGIERKQRTKHQAPGTKHQVLRTKHQAPGTKH
jgi:diaminohydroxyphosphoribosylaminopyrimidine deaminase/5-amino-6-(5-phosphoribosylamino)uracil reductase